MQQQKKNYPKFVKDMYELKFGNKKSAYKLAREMLIINTCRG
jgi:hypothetical protein